MSDFENPENCTPAEKAFDTRLKAALARYGAEKCAVVRNWSDGLDLSDDKEPPRPTEEQLAGMRLLMSTPARSKAADRYFEFVDPDGGFFTTSSGNEVVYGIKDTVKKAMAKPSKTAKFDELSMLTYALFMDDMWMHDNEAWDEGDEMQSACKDLAKAWKKLLGENTNEELGIDTEFTRPAWRRCWRTSRRSWRSRATNPTSSTLSSGDRELILGEEDTTKRVRIRRRVHPGQGVILRRTTSARDV